MNTEALIDRLGREASAVRPLMRPSVRAGAWLLLAIAYLVFVTFVIRRATPAVWSSFGGLLLVQQLLAFATGGAAVLAAFASVIPGRRTWGVLPAVLGMATVAALLFGCWRDLRMLGTLGIGGESDWPCVLSITLGGGVLLIPTFVLLRRGAPLTPAFTLSLAGLAALSVANVEACVTRSHAFVSTILVWHGLTVVACVAMLAWAAASLLRWPATSPQ